ncbi:MAG: GAF domain-containing protein [Gemmatimonadota bacterium]
MTALLDTAQLSPTPFEIARTLRDRISDWADPNHVAQTTAELLRTELGRPAVSVFASDPVSGDLLLLGTAPGGEHRAPKGSRRSADRGILDKVLREKTVQRSMNHYVAPDFVLSLPGETRSGVAVPVMGGAHLLGAIHLEYTTPHTPSAADEELAEHVADQLAAAWGGRASGARATSHDDQRVSRRLREASALAAIAGGLAQADDFESTFERIAVSAAEILGCRGALLLMRHPSRQMLEVVAGAGDLRLPAATLVPIDGTRAGQVLRSGKPAETTLRDVSGDPILPPGLVDSVPGDGLIVPVTSVGKTTGVLLAIDSLGGDGFSAEDVQLLQALADQAGAAEAIRSIPPLRQRISDASLIAEVGRAMTGTLGLDEVLALIVRAAEMLVSGRFASVGLLSDDRTNLVLAATSGTLRGKEGTSIPTRETVVTPVALAGESLITTALGADSRGWPLGDDFGPAALVPLESHGQIRGVLLVGRSVGAPVPSDEDLDALRKLAAYAAIAIDNARLYRQQTELSRTLQIQAEELEKAYADLGSSQERLLVSEKMAALGRVTAGIAHEINSPLGSILNCLQLATTYAEEYQSSADDPDVSAADHLGIAKDLLESLSLAEEATRRVAQFVRTIKGQTRMEEDEVLPFDPAEEAESTLLLLRHELDHGRISIDADLPRGLAISGDRNKFAVVVQNLVSNAVDAYDEGSGVVRIRLRQDSGSVILEVQDEGIGIPEEIRPRIYDYLFTTKDVGKGTGLGLSLAHSIVTSHFHGAIDFRSESGSGTTFVVTIPLPVEN